MKKIYLSLILLSATLAIQAQDLTSTSPTNKVAIVEEFTGTSCPACPAGHTAIKNLLASSTDAIAIAYSPSNSSLTGPNNGGVDTRRAFANAYYTNPYYDNGGGRSMPSFHVNRKVLSATPGRKVTTAAMPTEAAAINSEASPVNMGLESLYDAGSNELDIEVEMYFTQTVSNTLGLYVLITEDSVEANQSGSTQVPYYHYHLFRENVSAGQLGDALGTTTNAMDYATKTYSFDLNSTIDPLVIGECHVVAFLYDQTSGEVLTGISVAAENGSTRTAPASVLDLSKAFGMNIYPNPAQSEVNIAFENKDADDMKIDILSIEGKIVSSLDIQRPTIGENVKSISTSHLASGSYFLKISQGTKVGISKLQIR